MQIDPPTVATAIAAAVSFLKKPGQDVASKMVLDLYEKLRKVLGDKSDSSLDVADALAKLERKPESQGRADVLTEELTERGIETDKEVLAAVAALFKALPSTTTTQTMQVSVNQRGRNNTALVAGRDIVTTQQHTTRVEFTPDETHITPEQGRKLHALVRKLALKLRGEDGKPNFKDAWNRLYGKFDISSFRELKREDFEAAVSHLQTQGALNRSRLRRNDPEAYKKDLYSAIWAKANAAGLDKPAVYALAQQKLELKKPINTLKSLGPNQLKHLNEFLSRQ